jgi:hypothetical protein
MEHPSKPVWKVVRAGEKPPRIITEAFLPMVHCIEKMIKSDKKDFEKKVKGK